MKKTIIALTLVLAIALTLSITIPALAADPTVDTTTITGTVPQVLEVTAPADITVPGLDLQPGSTVTTPLSAGGDVVANVPWTLTVKDIKVTDAGYMTSATLTDKLDSKFQFVANKAGGTNILANADAAQTISGTGAAHTAISFAFSQAVSWTDSPATDYTIDITFDVAAD